MLLYAITARRLLPGGEPEQWAGLVALAREWAQGGVDYLQVREKDLPPEDLLRLARKIVENVREQVSTTRVFVNGPPEVALKAGADGVHLPGSAAPGAANHAREVYRRSGREATVSRACHSVEEVRTATDASLIVFAPVFEKVYSPQEIAVSGQGLAVLGEACRASDPVPVIALGGVTRENAPDCICAGAAGVAGIRLFLGDDWRKLR
jgi:thiamine-phosphate pyrophosphorylase